MLTAIRLNKQCWIVVMNRVLTNPIIGNLRYRQNLLLSYDITEYLMDAAVDGDHSFKF